MNILSCTLLITQLILSVNVFAQSKLDSLILNYINKYRGEHSLPPLKWSPLLYCMAETKAAYCKESKQDINSHDGMFVNELRNKESEKFIFHTCNLDDFKSDWALCESINPYYEDVDVFSYKLDIIANNVFEEMKNKTHLLNNTLEYAAVSHTIGNELNYYSFDMYTFEDYYLYITGTIYFIVFEATSKPKFY